MVDKSNLFLAKREQDGLIPLRMLKYRTVLDDSGKKINTISFVKSISDEHVTTFAWDTGDFAFFEEEYILYLIRNGYARHISEDELLLLEKEYNNA